MKSAEKERFIDIEFEGKIYPVNLSIFSALISKLSNENIAINTKEEALKYFDYYELYDGVFLENINKLVDNN